MSKPILYGVPFSQPVRAVMWLLLLKRTPFELVLTNPGSKGDNGSRNPAYLQKCPGGTIPCLEEPDSGFTLGEAHSIMTYLAQKNAWDDVYPADLQQRAKVDEYLHFHHRNVREASVGLVAPKIRKDLDIPEVLQQVAARNLSAALRMFDNHHLANSQYLCGDQVTLADIAAYVEIGQLRPEFTNVFDLTPYPNVTQWLADMSEIEGHDVVHVALTELGDISVNAPDMDTIRNANKKALVALKEQLATFA